MTKPKLLMITPKILYSMPQIQYSTALVRTHTCSTQKSYPKNYIHGFLLRLRLTIPLGIGAPAWAAVEVGILCCHPSTERFVLGQVW